MADEPPFHPPVAAATLVHTALPPRTSLGDAVNYHFRLLPCLHHRCAMHTHHRHQRYIRWDHAAAISLRNRLFRYLLLPHSCPTPHQYVLDAIGMRVAASGLALMWNTATNCPTEAISIDSWIASPPQATYSSLQQSVLLRGTTTIHNRCLVREGGEWCLFCGSNEGQHWGEHLHFDLRVDGNVLPNNSPLHSILSRQI